jgi:hypothetical protein
MKLARRRADRPQVSPQIEEAMSPSMRNLILSFTKEGSDPRVRRARARRGAGKQPSATKPRH